VRILGKENGEKSRRSGSVGGEREAVIRHLVRGDVRLAANITDVSRK
jgi:hypothetical protein